MAAGVWHCRLARPMTDTLTFCWQRTQHVNKIVTSEVRTSKHEFIRKRMFCGTIGYLQDIYLYGKTSLNQPFTGVNLCIPFRELADLQPQKKDTILLISVMSKAGQYRKGRPIEMVSIGGFTVCVFIQYLKQIR